MGHFALFFAHMGTTGWDFVSRKVSNLPGLDGNPSWPAPMVCCRSGTNEDLQALAMRGMVPLPTAITAGSHSRDHCQCQWRQAWDIPVVNRWGTTSRGGTPPSRPARSRPRSVQLWRSVKPCDGPGSLFHHDLGACQHPPVIPSAVLCLLPISHRR